MGWTGIVGQLSNVADTVVQDLGAFGVIGASSNVGGHATTQVVRNAATGTTQITTTQTGSSYVLLLAAALAVVIGLFLLIRKD